MKNKTTTKNLKPNGINLYLEYRCPDCCATHWLKLDEVKTPGFIVVCDCRRILKFKPIKKIKLCYRNKTTTDTKTLDPAVLEKSCEALSKYGFDSSESSALIHHAFAQLKTNDVSTLVKLAIKLFGDK